MSAKSEGLDERLRSIVSSRRTNKALCSIGLTDPVRVAEFELQVLNADILIAILEEMEEK